MRDIAKNIRAMRTAKNMTQDELAEKLFVTRQTVSNYETGKSRPDVEMLTKIAEVLETDIHALIYGMPTPPSRKKSYLLAAICSAIVLLNLGIYTYLLEEFNFIARMHYRVRPTILLMTVYRPLFFLLLGWTLMQILGCFTTIKPFTGAKAKRVSIILRLVLALFFLAEAPLILACFVEISMPVWWQHLAWYIHGNVSSFSWLSISRLPILIGTGFWLCGLPCKLHG